MTTTMTTTEITRRNDIEILGERAANYIDEAGRYDTLDPKVAAAIAADIAAQIEGARNRAA